jgi:hypothetical protein
MAFFLYRFGIPQRGARLLHRAGGRASAASSHRYVLRAKVFFFTPALCRGETGSIVTLLCDGGERYAGPYSNDDWLAEHGAGWRAAAARIALLLGDG